MKSICLQAGHQNAPNNCDPNLRKGTGAPGEVDFTIRVRDELSKALLSKKLPDGSPAFTVQLVDACFNCDPKADDKDYDLFLAIHYDADIYNAPGGFVDFPDPNTDFATKESQRIAKVFEENYFKHSGIENHPERRNANTKFYYMWKFLSAKTPCVIIECGVGQNAHDKVILSDPHIVPNAIARSICAAFNVPFDAISPQPPATDEKEKEITRLKQEVEALKQTIKTTQNEALENLANIKAKCQEKITLLEQVISDLKMLL